MNLLTQVFHDLHIGRKTKGRSQVHLTHRHGASHFLAPVVYYNAPEYLRLGSSVNSQQGRRRTMEDEYVTALCDNLEMFAVFDGHGGSTVAKYAADELAKFLLPEVSKAMTADGFDCASIEKLIKDIFLEFDQRIYDENLVGGCCSLIAIFNHDTLDLFVVNLGDSHALVFNNSRQILLETIELTPADDIERQRIQRAGEEVERLHEGGPLRIGGRLAVSRALGDRQFKSEHHNGYYSGGAAPVSPVPLVSHMDLRTPGDYYAVLACDGFWFDGSISNHFTQDEIMSMILDKKLVAQDLVEGAIERDSGDNVTVMIVKFVIQ